MKTSNLIQSVERAMDILELVSKYQEQGIGILQLAREVGLNSSTAHNLVRTLRAKGYLSQIEISKKYCLSKKCLKLARGRLEKEEMVNLLEPVMLKLAKEIWEAITLAYYEHGKRYVIRTIESQQEIKVDHNFIQAESIYITPTGRVLLAYLPEKELEHCIEVNGFPEDKWDSINNLESLKTALDKIREDGYAIIERKSSIVALGVSIKNVKGVPVALGTFMPFFRFKGRKRNILKVLLSNSREMAKILEQSL